MRAEEGAREAARGIARARLAPTAAERDRAASFPRAELQELGRLGLMGLLVPEEWGGTGADHHALAAALQEIAAADAVCALIMASQNTLANQMLLQFGTQEQKETYLRPFARGEKLCAFALSEADAGSDAFRLRTEARRSGDGYVLKGSKQFVTAGRQCDFAIVIARTNESAPNQSAFSAFIVDRRAKGYVAGRAEDTLGLRSSDSGQIHLDGLEISELARIGPEGAGHSLVLAVLGRSRFAVAAQCLGIARAAYETALRYSMERKTFGKQIISHQAIAFRVADMALDLRAAELLVRDSARLLDAGQAAEPECSMAKLFASEMAERVCREAMQILGGYGYSREFPVERHYRDARACTIYEGTSDIQRLLISNAVVSRFEREP